MQSRSLSALLFLALVLALGLSAAPQLHDSLHQTGDRTNHECAATLMSSGSVEHSDCEPAAAPPRPAPGLSTFRIQVLPTVLASFEFARLEHAPPFSS